MDTWCDWWCEWLAWPRARCSVSLSQRRSWPERPPTVLVWVLPLLVGGRWEICVLRAPPSVLPIGRELSPVHTLRLPTLITQPPNSLYGAQGFCALRPAFSRSGKLRGCSAPSPVTGLCNDNNLSLYCILLARYFLHNILLNTSSKPLKRLVPFC